ncbi:MAG: sigma-54 dependent transcriptional regulator [Proteobacteria bacterium]|nr:sigma-54-dependent Fis family transcriptional regulator [Desulfobacula sp.]MBU3952616.1 sigma-54 dependent transcriptional regulator [Pseudomonadota bacterium]MBU4129311.1 sigma-54 dependent transcriptional regulator [Pseudomonadota bacterium]
MDQQMKILIVDDELVVRESLYHWFSREGYHTQSAKSGKEALEKLETENFDTLFVDMKMPGMSGFELLEIVKKRYPDTAVVIITAYGSIDTAVQAMKIGASDYLLKPFKPDQLSLIMEKISQQIKLASEYRYLKGQMDKICRFDNIIGESDPMKKIYTLIEEVAKTDAPVLILGETGTGKELIAKAIHVKSHRNNLPFVPLNCGAFPDSLLESELFGYNKGAFTGASHNRKGFFEVVSGGTLFLDEIGEVSQKMQVSLLRVLQEKKITRLGDTRGIDVDFRLLSATRQDLESKILDGHFRSDFFYRINIISIEIPPLRERKEDIALLAYHFLEKYSQETTKKVDTLDKKTLEYLKRYPWPGNVRELENAIERAVVLSKSRTLTLEDFYFLKPVSSPFSIGGTLTLKDMERQYINTILQDSQWNITRSAEILGISRATLHRIIKRFHMEKP